MEHCVMVWSETELFREGCRPMYWYNQTTGERVPYFCNSARCHRPECVNNWARKRLAMCNDLIRKIGKPRFFTLSIDRSHTVAEAWDMIGAWWNHMRIKVNRWLKKLDMPPMKYFAVLEAHKDGYPHIHGFWNFYIPQNILSHMWSQCAPGYIVDVRAVEDDQMASDYLFTELGKYLGKGQSIQGARMAGHRKRTFWRSRGLWTDYELDRMEPGLDNGEWTLIKEYRNGSKKRGREDMEGTCSPALEEGIRTGGAHLETEGAQGGRRPEGETSARPAHEDQCADQENQGELDYGDPEERYEGYPGCTKSGEKCISYYGNKELPGDSDSGRDFPYSGEQCRGSSGPRLTVRGQ